MPAVHALPLALAAPALQAEPGGVQQGRQAE
jgi:hypothetical protein